LLFASRAELQETRSHYSRLFVLLLGFCNRVAGRCGNPALGERGVGVEVGIGGGGGGVVVGEMGSHMDLTWDLGPWIFSAEHGRC
jgi:hypothetical protein